MLFIEGRSVRQPHRALLDGYALLLSRLQGRLPANGLIWHGQECRATRVRLSTELQKADRLLGELRWMRVEAVPPRLVRNDPCALCEFRQRCHQQAVEEDTSSLRRGLKEKAVKSYARQGIRTVTQLAHPFRPWRRRRRSRKGGPAHKPALQALAIRDRKAYVFGSPQLPDAPARVYLDLEGKPDERFVYLLGVIMADGVSAVRHSFGADRPEEELRIVDQLLRLLQPYERFQVFCYGSYERTFRKRMRKYARRKRLVDQVRARRTNVLAVIYDHVYFPVYSNGLKEVARFLGFAGTDPEASSTCRRRCTAPPPSGPPQRCRRIASCPGPRPAGAALARTRYCQLPDTPAPRTASAPTSSPARSPPLPLAATSARLAPVAQRARRGTPPAPPKCSRNDWSRRGRTCSLSRRSCSFAARRRRTSPTSWRTKPCSAATAVGSGASGLASSASLLTCGIRHDRGPAVRPERRRVGTSRRAGSGRLQSLVALEATEVLDIDAVEDHLQLAGRQFEGARIGRREVEATTLQALVPDAHAVAVPVADFDPPTATRARHHRPDTPASPPAPGHRPAAVRRSGPRAG